MEHFKTAFSKANMIRNVVFTFVTHAVLDEGVLQVAEAESGVPDVVFDDLYVPPGVALLGQPLVELLQDGDVGLGEEEKSPKDT